MSENNIEGKQSAFNPADITALSHLYRGERSTVWRTRLDTTTNWAVLTTGIGRSLFSELPSPHGQLLRGPSTRIGARAPIAGLRARRFRSVSRLLQVSF